MATSKAQKNTNAARRKRTSGSSSSSSSSSSSIATDSKVAARAQLDERSGAGVQDRLEERAKEQEKQQQQQLRDGVASGDEKKAAEARAERAEIDPASARSGASVHPDRAPGVQGGFVDQLSARPGRNDVFEGHFCRIDLNAKDVPERLVESGRDYGVYLEPALRDADTGYPVTARVRLRDDSHEVVVVPYDALRPAQAGGR